MRLAILVPLGLFASALGAQSPLTAPCLPGPHGVGFRVVQQYDNTRGYKGTFDLTTGQRVQGEKARPVQTLIWYPALRGGKALAYRDYVRTRVTQEAFDSLAEAYETQKNTELAIQNYRRSVELNPKNDNGIQHLKALGAPGKPSSN